MFLNTPPTPAKKKPSWYSFVIYYGYSYTIQSFVWYNSLFLDVKTMNLFYFYLLIPTSLGMEGVKLLDFRFHERFSYQQTNFRY